MAERCQQRTQVVVIGSGAGGAVTALELVRGGAEVVVLEEGMRYDHTARRRSSTEGMKLLYRRHGMTPIMGRVPLGFVEGACLGGSTEINSGFWHRTPREVLLRWKVQYDLAGASAGELAPHFAWAEELTSVQLHAGPWPKSTQAFQRGIREMGWSAQEIPRAARHCSDSNNCAAGCPLGAKQGMSLAVWPQAEALGVRLLTGCRAHQLLSHRGRVSGVLAELEVEQGQREFLRIDAEHVFVCAGPTETPSLLRRSGIKSHVGESLRVHPMLKVAARFPERLDAHASVLPLLQVKEFWPEVSLGGAFFTRSHLAVVLSDNWPANSRKMDFWRHMATFYVAAKGTGCGWVRPSMVDGAPLMRYDLSDADLAHLSKGLARLAALLIAAGAEEVFPSAKDVAPIKSEADSIRWLDDELPASGLSLTTVHAFSTCPIGERSDRCAADSFGKVRGYSNLYVNDASMLPDSPGVNPQGSVMAIARRNVHHFLDFLR